MPQNFLEKARLHPLLLGLYSVLGLLAANVVEIPPQAGLRALSVALLMAFGLTWAMTQISKDRLRAGMVASLALLFFFSYGHVYLSLEQAGSFFGRHRYLGRYTK